MNETYKEENRLLLISRGKLACIFGITLVPIFSGLDYVLVPHLWFLFFILRASNTVQNLIVYSILKYKKNLSPLQIKLLMTFYFLGIAVMIAYMCRKMGGYKSTYYAGLNLEMLLIGLIMPWSAFWTAFNGAIVYSSFLILGYHPDFQSTDLISSSYFLLSTTLVAIVGAFWTNRLREKEFLMRQELKELDRAKSAFFANVSHELKTPTALILAPIEMALSKLPLNVDPFIKETFEMVRHNGYRLSSLINDLLDLTRGEIGKVQIKPIRVENPENYFSQIFKSLVPLMNEKEIRYEFKVDS